MKNRKPLFVVALLVLVLLVAELIAWVAYAQLYDDREERFLRAFLGLEAGLFPNHVAIYLPHHYLIYVLKPGAQLQDRLPGASDELQARHYINSLGFRGRETTVEKPEGTFRIVCAGGSTTFGIFEYDEQNTYPALLETWLNQRFDAPQFEVINAGTPGWTSAENLINLQLRLLELSPDMVVLYQGVNDTFAMRRADEGGPDYRHFRRSIDYRRPTALNRLLLRLSRLYRLVYVRWLGRERVNFDIAALAARPKPADWEENLDRATGRFFRRNLRSQVAVAKMHGVVPILVTMGHGPWHSSLGLMAEITREIAAAEEVPLVDFERAWGPGFFESDNVHLTVRGRTALASRVLDAVVEANPGFTPASDQGAR